MNNVKDIKDQKLGSILADFQTCRHCRIVDRDYERLGAGYVCPECGVSEGGTAYFAPPVRTLINLMQEAFHAPPEAGVSDMRLEGNAHNVSVILFFCTLREVLINGLIDWLCRGQNIPKLVYKRLLRDNNTYLKKQNNLLRSLTGKKREFLIKEKSGALPVFYT